MPRPQRRPFSSAPGDTSHGRRINPHATALATRTRYAGLAQSIRLRTSKETPPPRCSEFGPPQARDAFRPRARMTSQRVSSAEVLGCRGAAPSFRARWWRHVWIPRLITPPGPPRRRSWARARCHRGSEGAERCHAGAATAEALGDDLGHREVLGGDHRVSRGQEPRQHGHGAGGLYHAVSDDEDLVGRLVVAALRLDRTAAAAPEVQPGPDERDVEAAVSGVAARCGPRR